jgi:hypothetical protein
MKIFLRFPGSVIESWTRCKIHNAAEGGSSTSSHLPIWDDLDADMDPDNEFAQRSCGADIHPVVVNPPVLSEIVSVAICEGATGIGIHSWGCHIDVKPRRKPLTIWRPKAGGGYEYLL